MSNPPPGLGGGVARTGPPPGFGSTHPNNHNLPQSPSTNSNNNQQSSQYGSPGAVASPSRGSNTGSLGNGGNNGGGSGSSENGTAVIIRAQIVFLLTTFTEESFEKSAGEIRALASAPDMYGHYVRRMIVVANPVLQTILQHYNQYKDDPNPPPPANLPTTGPASLAWRLLVTEAVRAARDVQLAPHFISVMLSTSQSTPLPLPTFRVFELPPALLFTLSSFTLASPHIFSPTHPHIETVYTLFQQNYQPTMELLRTSNTPFWGMNTIPGQGPYTEDLSLQEARTLILALYPRSNSNGGSTGTTSRPPTPTNPTSPHPSSLNSGQRATFLSSLAVKFSSPAIILQTLSALSPGGAPRSPGSIPLEDILFELGENLTQDEGTVEAVIGRWWGPYLLEGGDTQALNEEASKTLFGLCEGLQTNRMVDFHGVIAGLTNIPGISPMELMKSFDVPNTIAAFPSSLGLTLSLMLLPPASPVPPIAGLLPASIDAPIWSNMSSLLSVLAPLLNLPPDAIPLFTIPNSPPPESFARIINPAPSENVWSKLARTQSRDIQGAGLWNTIGLIKVLVEATAMAEIVNHDRQDEERAEIGRIATRMLEKAADLAPELLLIALERLPKPLPDPLTAKHKMLLEVYLSSPSQNVTSSHLVFHQMNELDQENLVQVLVNFYNLDENNLGRVMEIANEVKILPKLLASDNLHFAFDVAAFASSKEWLDLEKWLADGVAVNGQDFLQGIFDFVEHKIRLEIDHQHAPENTPPIGIPLTSEVYSIFIRVVRNADELAPEDIGRFKNLRTDILILHPRLLNLRPGSKEEQGFSVARFDKDINTEVDKMYEKMYAETLKLDEVISELKRCQKSDDPRDRELFAGALHSLFDEYRFVKGYPPKELAMTGILFGAVIDYRLVKDTAAFVATRYVLDACKTSPQDPLYQFGINALSVLRASLVDFPGLCRSLLEVPALHESHPVLINEILSALQEREELDQQGGVKLAFPALKLPILLEEGDDEFIEPEPKKKDAIMFIINQITPANFEAKVADLQKLFENQYSRWFAHYFIDVRVSLEANRHETYIQILELLHSSLLEKHVLWETYRKARDILNAETTMSSASERAVLKTIAMWLGRITLSRNKPIKFRELSVKDLLMQGYDNKRLIVAIPFVCNLMVFCKDSLVFKPPNPWMVAVLSLLVEFYHYAELRLNLKFEIEVLFSKLGVSLDTVEPSNLLRNHVPPPEPQPELPNRLELELQRANRELTNGTQRFTEQPSNDAFLRMQQMQTEAAAQAAQDAFLRRVDELIAHLPEYLVFSQDYPIFTAPTLKRIVHHSIDRAIREIVNPVVERSVTIAGISSRDLVQKDFGTEGDPLKMRHAAHLMVQNLAGNLALVTCKEPLRTSMTSNIRNMLSQNGFTEDNMPEVMVAGVVTDNLDVACSVIKKAAMEKAAKDIDVNLAPQYAARKAHRDSRSQQPFWDGASYGVAISHTALPDPLRLRTGGLTTEQLRVYEDFGEPSRVPSMPLGHDPRHLSVHQQQQMSHQQQQQQHQQHQQHQQPGSQPMNGGGDYSYSQDGMPDLNKRGPSPRNLFPQELSDQTSNSVSSPIVVPPQTSIERFQEVVAEVEKFLAQGPNLPVGTLSEDIRGLIRAVVVIANSSANREHTTLAISQKVVQLLYKTSSPLGREIFTLMLQQLCDHAPKVDAEVKQWLIYADDARKLNVPVTSLLIRASFINVSELDGQLAQMILRSFAPDLLDFVAELIRECSLGDQAIIPRHGFTHSLAALLKSREMGRASPSVEHLLDDLRVGSAPARAHELTPPNGDNKPSIDQDRLAHFFFDWVRVFSSAKSPESAFVPYITYLQQEGILNGEDISSAFYRTAINCAVDLDTSKANEPTGQFVGTDSLAKLIVLIVKNYGDKSSTSSVQRAVYYYNKIITIVSYSLVQRQLELGESFNQRPWTRFFTTMLSELSMLEYNLPETYIGCLKHFANVLGITQPTYAPRFGFGWLSIVSHRLFMSKLLGSSPREAGWPEFHRCLMWLLRFMSPFLKSGEMNSSSRSIYKATLRLLLVLMHDFPEFLCEYYHTLTTAIPTQCVQLRNIVLAAFPRSETPVPSCYKRLEQLVPDMQIIPVVRSDYVAALNNGNVKPAIDQYVRGGVPALSAIVTELKNRIAIKSISNEGNTVVTWNNTLLHATVFYLGTSCVERRARQTSSVEFDPKAPEVALLTALAFTLDSEGQYYMLSVIADQLRYPSAHTLFFTSFLLYLFGTASRADASNNDNNSASIPERIGRVLLERVIVRRPHPWGLIVCFIELLDNEMYGFWKQPFVRAEEEIYLLFREAHSNFVEDGAAA